MTLTFLLILIRATKVFDRKYLLARTVLSSQILWAATFCVPNLCSATSYSADKNEKFLWPTGSNSLALLAVNFLSRQVYFGCQFCFAVNFSSPLMFWPTSVFNPNNSALYWPYIQRFKGLKLLLYYIFL